MYCMNCGALNRDGSKFCKKCGCRLDEVQIDESGAGNKKGIKKKAGIIITVLTVAAAAVIFITVLGNREKDSEKRNRKDSIAMTEETASGEDAVTNKNFSLDGICEQCEDCRGALETYVKLMETCSSLDTAKEDIDALAEQKCQEMQHVCTAPIIYVENIPYACLGSYGTYTGDWMGAGPSGAGTYTGAVYGTNAVSYTGDWGYGLPNGEGQLYMENYLGDWDMTYNGQMKNGKRDGTGSWFESYDNKYQPDNEMFRIYAQANYVDGQLTDWTDCVTYDAATGEVEQYCKMKTDEYGNPLMGETWGPDDLSPEDKETLGIATAVVSLGMIAYLTDAAVTAGSDYDYGQSDQDMLNELNSYRENQVTEKQAELAQQQAENESYKNYCADKYDDLYSSGEEGSLDGQYFGAVGYGY